MSDKAERLFDEVGYAVYSARGNMIKGKADAIAIIDAALLAERTLAADRAVEWHRKLHPVTHSTIEESLHRYVIEGGKQ